MVATPEFSFKTRQEALLKFREQTFDFLIIGGGITGAAVARDAASRGLKVAVVEKNDFAFGTSSRSSKLIHGGLRYLENFEFRLVFEALTERALLLRTAPHMVRPLPFYFPVYEGDPHGKGIIAMGMWLYDLLALFRTPGAHKNLSRQGLLDLIPFLRSEGLSGGFRYYDASMWDDALAIQTLRSAHEMGAQVANYVEALNPIFEGERISGFRCKDLEALSSAVAEFDIKARRVILCAGPWTDRVGSRLSSAWKPWLKPSKGVHLVFDIKRIPVPGAMVMSHPEDGRISFVIPRPDFGAGVVIVGTTDDPAPQDPDQLGIEKSEVKYLMRLLHRYFPILNLTTGDIVSAYVGIRPLMDTGAATLQKISREHHIDLGPGGTTIVAGGKYTTHRMMGKEIVDFTLKDWRRASGQNKGPAFPLGLRKSETRSPVFYKALPKAVAEARAKGIKSEHKIPEELFSRYGADAIAVADLDSNSTFPVGLPLLAAQLKYTIRNEMVMHLEDFFIRRVPLFLSRSDHGLPWAEVLSKVWASELGKGEKETLAEFERLRAEFDRRNEWKKSL
ncbi:MAG: glycerol-3-phosphate dehydrogenase/oxidase [Bdellovibrionota bacterium]